jgi:hypothetical protein
MPATVGPTLDFTPPAFWPTRTRMIWRIGWAGLLLLV